MFLKFVTVMHMHILLEEKKTFINNLLMCTQIQINYIFFHWFIFLKVMLEILEIYLIN